MGVDRQTQPAAGLLLLTTGRIPDNLDVKEIEIINKKV
jgi:hypothetical protein